ncbi:MAG: universal stress protein [Atopobiaceae bacterium]
MVESQGSQSTQELGYNKIFVSLDSSDQQGHVLDRAIIAAANNHAMLFIGHVIDASCIEPTEAVTQETFAQSERAFRERIAPAVERAESLEGIQGVEVLVKYGRIRETLKEEMLDVIEPDLIICGARGLSSISYALLGSISTYLVRSSKCDTLVIK